MIKGPEHYRRFASDKDLFTYVNPAMIERTQIQEDIMHEAVSKHLGTSQWSQKEEIPHLLLMEVRTGYNPLEYPYILYYEEIPLLEWKWSEDSAQDTDFGKTHIIWTIFYTFLGAGKQSQYLTSEGNAVTAARLFAEKQLVLDKECIVLYPGSKEEKL